MPYRRPPPLLAMNSTPATSSAILMTASVRLNAARSGATKPPTWPDSDQGINPMNRATEQYTPIARATVNPHITRRQAAG